MANYSALIKVINNQIKANGNQEITGPVLNAVLQAMVSALGEGYQFMGLATPDTNPGTPDGRVFYIAADAGVYANFGEISINQGITIIYNDDNNWLANNLLTIKSEMGDEDDAVMSQAAVRKNIDKLTSFVGYGVFLDDKVVRLDGSSFKDYVASSNYKSAKVEVMSSSGTIVVEGATLMNCCFFSSKEISAESFLGANKGNIIEGAVLCLVQFENSKNADGYDNLVIKQPKNYASTYEDVQNLISDTQKLKEDVDVLNNSNLVTEDDYSVVAYITDKAGKILAEVDKNGCVNIIKGGFADELAQRVPEINGIKRVVVDKNNKAIAYLKEDGVYIPRLNSESIAKEMELSDDVLVAVASSVSKENFNSEFVKNAVFQKKGLIERKGLSNYTPPSLISLFDDDTIDKNINSSKPSSWMVGGYLTTLYPLLASVSSDFIANLALEGDRAGFTEEDPALNENGQICLKLQKEKSWGIACHSMTSMYPNNNYYLESLSSELATQIANEATVIGQPSNTSNTTVYVADENKNYYVDSDRTWKEVPIEYIKSIVMDYSNKKYKMYNPTFPVDYQIGEWIRIAKELGFGENYTWVAWGTSCCRELAEKINSYIPFGFGNKNAPKINLPPLLMTVERLSLEQQDDYIGEQDTDNSYKPELLAEWKQYVDDVESKGGWLVLSMHAYRPCWKNSWPGELVSEGGSYPDEWVQPVRDRSTYPLNYLDAPAEIGITSWSQWHPCPNTRLYMVYELLQYIKRKNIKWVSAVDGYNQIGNIFSIGSYLNGYSFSADKQIDGGEIHPYCVLGIDRTYKFFNK